MESIDQVITSSNKLTGDLSNTMESLMIFVKPTIILQITQWELRCLLLFFLAFSGACIGGPRISLVLLLSVRATR